MDASSFLASARATNAAGLKALPHAEVGAAGRVAEPGIVGVLLGGIVPVPHFALPSKSRVSPNRPNRGIVQKPTEQELST